MEELHGVWSGFVPFAMGGDMDSVAHQEFSRTLFNMWPDIALCVLKHFFEGDMKSYLRLVNMPCHIVQSTKGLSIPVSVAEYLHENFNGELVIEVRGPPPTAQLAGDCRTPKQWVM